MNTQPALTPLPKPVYRAGESEYVQALRQRINELETLVAENAVKESPASETAGLIFLQKLAPRERHVTAMVAEGMRNKEIATKLGTTEQVIKNYLRFIYEKCAVRDRLNLLIYVRSHPALQERLQSQKDIPIVRMRRNRCVDFSSS